MNINIDEVKKHIEYLRKDRYDNEFYVALLLYDVLGYNEKMITQEMADNVHELRDKYNSIYKEDINDELLYELKYEFEKSMKKQKDYER